MREFDIEGLTLVAGNTDVEFNPEHWIIEPVEAAIKRSDDTPKVKLHAIADEHDSLKSYSKDDIVMHEGLRYKCKSDIGPGEWDGELWQLENVQSDINHIQSEIDNINKKGVFLWNIYQLIQYQRN